MSEFTPTTEQVRSAYAHDPEAEYRDPVGFPAMQRENLRAFDRWLAAHDAEVRGGVVSEEPEWEYGVAPSASLDQVWPISEEGARATVRAEPGAWVALRRQRVVLPPWVPVKQEGTEQ